MNGAMKKRIDGMLTLIRRVVKQSVDRSVDA
jgi:hypothetical protein